MPIFTLLVAVLLLPVLVPLQAQAAVGNGKIAFVSDRDGDKEIFVMNVDGSDQRPLTANAVEDSEPAWSLDGSKIAFRSMRDDSDGDIYVMSAEGADVTRLTTYADIDRSPTWSPDSSQIAFARYIGGFGLEIYIRASTAGGSEARCTSNSTADTEPAWSPGGTRLAFAENTVGGKGYIYWRLTSDCTGASTQVTAPDLNHREPAWSPDSSQIAYRRGTTEAATDNDIFIEERDGLGDPSNLTNTTGINEKSPTWSPDGKKTAYSATQSGITQIYSINVDGSGSTNLTRTSSNETDPSWQKIEVDSDGGSGKGSEPGITDGTKPTISDLRAKVRTKKKKKRSRVKGKNRYKRTYRVVINYKLSEAATVQFTVKRKLVGRMDHGTCRRPSKRLRKKKRCTRTKKVDLVTQQGVVGSNLLTLKKKFASYKIKSGSYVLVTVATDSSGNKSMPASVSFKVPRDPSRRHPG